MGWWGCAGCSGCSGSRPNSSFSLGRLYRWGRLAVARFDRAGKIGSCQRARQTAMSPRENLLSLYRRRGYETAPVCFNLCPDSGTPVPPALSGRGGLSGAFPVPHAPDHRSGLPVDRGDSRLRPGAPMELRPLLRPAHRPRGPHGHLGHRARARRRGGQAHDAHAPSAGAHGQPRAVAGLSLARVRQGRLVVSAPRGRGHPGPRAGGPGVDGMHDLGDRLVPAAHGPA